MPLVPTFQRVGQSSSCLQLKTRLSPRRTRPSIRATAFPTSSEGASSLPPPPPPPPLNALAPLVEGKKFTCTECGKCCSGAGEVWANSKEVAALAKSMGLAEKHFKSKFTKSYSKRQGWFLLQRKQGSGECIFLKDGKRCTVYNARPMQCLTYPFWPELMGDRAWLNEAEDVCEGINHADAVQVDVDDAARKLAAAAEYTAEFDAAGLARSSGRKRY